MKVYLDDERIEPAGWERTRTAAQTIELLRSRTVTALSLDHDLGACKACLANADDRIPTECHHNGNGYDVAVWLEEQIFTDPTFPVPTLAVHSANPAGVRRIQQAFDAIEKRVKER